jgi:hypothetical protein
LLFRDPARPRYETLSSEGLDMATDAKLAALERTFDQFAV